MSNFTPLVPFSIEFDGDNITMNLRRMKKKLLMKIAPFFDDSEVDKSGKLKLTIESQLVLVNMMEDVLPNQVENFDGLMAKDNTTIPLEDMIPEAYFLELSSDIFGEIFKISNPNLGKKDDPKDKGEAGNLNGQESEAPTDS